MGFNSGFKGLILRIKEQETRLILPEHDADILLNTLFPNTLNARHLSLSWARLLRSYQIISPGSRLSLSIFRNNIRFYGEEFLEPRPSPKVEDHPLSAVRDCLFNIFAATLHIGGRSSTHKLRKRHAVVTGTQLSQSLLMQKHNSSVPHLL